MEKNGSKVVEGEALDLVVGNMPFNPKKDEKILQKHIYLIF